MDILKQIKLISTDVDGVLTDGGLYIDKDGLEFKRYNVLDGQGVKNLLNSGIIVCFISSSDCSSIVHRAKKLGVEHCYTGVQDKYGRMNSLLRSLNIEYSDVCHIADDINDVPLLKAVGYAVAVQNAVSEVKAVSNYVTSHYGGHGAFREVADMFLNKKLK